MKLSLALFALAVAQSGYDTPTTQTGAEYYDTPSTETEGTAPEYYAQQAEPQYAQKAEPTCKQVCPIKAPCFSEESGKCAEKQSYKQYGKEVVGECPAGYSDESDNLPSQVWPFWVGFALLFTPGFWFLCITIGDIFDDGTLDAVHIFTKVHMLQRLIAGGVCLVASLAYFAMATNNGLIYRCCDGRVFYYARYVDWIITTPFMLYELISIAQSARVLSDRVQDFELWYIILLNLLMIVSGLIGTLVCSNAKWVFFAFAIIAFIPILKLLVFLCWLPKTSAGDDGRLSSQKLYRRLACLTVIVWSLYPLAWILSTGTGVISATGENVFYMVLDVLAKAMFAFIITTQLKPIKIQMKDEGL